MKAIFFALLIALSIANFSGTDVHEFTQDDFKAKVQDQKTFWVIVEYSQLSSEQRDQVVSAAEALKGMINVGALSNGASTTLRVYSNGQAIEYPGEWEAQEIVNFAFDQIRDFAFKRVGKVPKKQGEKTPEPQIDESDVIVLTDDNLDETILNSKDAWFVEFYAPWCGHCKKLAPEWAKLATSLKGEIKVAKIDASVEGSKSKTKYKVEGFPTIRFFGAGEKVDGDYESFDGARDYNTLLNYARETNRKLKPLFFEQLVNQQQFTDNCLKSTGICVLLFVPHIYDCDQECRDGYLNTYKESVKPLKSKPLVHFWSQAGDQYELEEQFGMSGAGYPSVLALSPKKQLFSKMRGSVTSANVDRFLNNLLNGKEQVSRFGSVVPIEEVKN
ncbi:unnamed protein product [Paramecium primaurelia]|uniref:protein disulfide-isomerase n=1 Tax=Paramecium primaurelia TaxID=5886 RepID=A0A8S1MLH7_PARPR|nr:unnamed protein product [Paramecium primaurelia]